MRKFLSLLLVLVMLLGTLPLGAWAAEGPAKSEDGVYQISTAEELLWFAETVNGGDTKLSAVLTADIDLTEVSTWPGIGVHKNRFAGSFDGQGHTVTFQNANWGMFGFVQGSSTEKVTIKNIRTKGTIRRSAMIHDANYVRIEDCINGATVTNLTENHVAGIIGSVEGVRQGNGTYASLVEIVRCGNEASITAAEYVGGIVGYAWVNTKLDNCYNIGNIAGEKYVGGIAGHLQSAWGDTSMQNCYNTGRITGSDSAAGLVGNQYNGVYIKNSFNAGSAFHAVSGSRYNNTGSITNTYFLGTASAKSNPDYTSFEGLEITQRATAVSAAEMAKAEFAALLGDAFVQSCPYPVLSWQTPKEHTGAVCANCKLGSTEKEDYDVSFQEHPGYTLIGEAKATQGKPYTFTITINEGYEAVAGFEIKANGVKVNATSSGQYVVNNVQGPLSITVRNVQVIPGNHTISLPGTGYGYRVEGAKSAVRDEPYSFTLSFVSGFQAGPDFKVIAQEVLSLDELNKGTVPYEVEVTGSNGVYTIPSVQKNYRILVSGVVAVPTVAPVTVNFTVTEGWYNFHEPNDSGELMIDRELTVPYFDLSLYGLEKYYYNPYCYLNPDGSIKSVQAKGTPETAYNNITVMHAYIAATELFYMGYQQKDVGTGAAYKKNPAAFKEIISWSQDAGSSFMDFWDHGTNLNYYVNYEYPLAYAGWGSTSDQIVLKDGDVISVHMITGQGSGSNFGFFAYDNDDGKYKPGDTNINSVTVDQGQKVKLQYFWTATSGSYTTSYKKQANKQLYWVNAEEYGIPNSVQPVMSEDDEGNPVQEDGWRTAALGNNTRLVTDSEGRITIDTAGLEPGTYYIGALGGFEAGGGKDDAGFVSAGYEAGPAFFRLVVEEYDCMIGDLNSDTEITAKDATVILQGVAGMITDLNDTVADVNGDGEVTAKDATQVLQFVAGTIDEFPANSQ